MAKRPSFNEVCDYLAEAMAGLHDDTRGVDYAQAMANLAGKNLSHYKALVDYRRLMGSRRSIKWFEEAE